MERNLTLKEAIRKLMKSSSKSMRQMKQMNSLKRIRNRLKTKKLMRQSITF